MVIYYTGDNTVMHHSLFIFERFVKLKQEVGQVCKKAATRLNRKKKCEIDALKKPGVILKLILFSMILSGKLNQE